MASHRWLGLSEDGQQVVLKRFTGEFLAPPPSAQMRIEDAIDRRRGAVIDVECTGLNYDTEQVIEIGLRTFEYDGRTGALQHLGESYSGLQDPGRPLEPEIVRLTGITDADLAGQRIDWQRVAELLDSVDLIFAHNASFDRPFVDRYLPPNDRTWGCSVRQVDWRAHGFRIASLEVLAIFHGFFVDAHRALEDADATLHLLTHPVPDGEHTYLVELSRNALAPGVRFDAVKSPFELKGLLKARKYRWKPAPLKVWSREVPQHEAEAERQWLLDEIYGGRARWQETPIAAHDRFRTTD